MRGKILYIEDNPVNMRLIKKLLLYMEFDLIEARDGQSGLALAESAHPDLILLDVYLPDVDGIELAAQIKNTPHLAHIPLIAITADTGLAAECRAAGCNAYLNKPVSSTLLLKTVLQFIESPSREFEG